MTGDVAAQRSPPAAVPHRAHAASSVIACVAVPTGLPRPATSRSNIAVASTMSVLTPLLEPLVGHHWLPSSHRPCRGLSAGWRHRRGGCKHTASSPPRPRPGHARGASEDARTLQGRQRRPRHPWRPCQRRASSPSTDPRARRAVPAELQGLCKFAGRREIRWKALRFSDSRFR